jgi:hypothetical protein
MFPFPAPLLCMGADAVVIGPYGNHSYWRLFADTNHGDPTYISVSELRFLDADGVEIPATGGTAFASTGTAAYAIDGTELGGNFWAATSPTNGYVGYHFATPVGAAQITIKNVADAAQTLARAVKAGRLQYSDDGSAYTDAFTFNQFAPIQGATRQFPEASPPAGKHRAWRVFSETNNGDGNYLVITEIEMRAATGGADQTSNVGVNNPFGSSAGRPIGSVIDRTNGQGYRAFDNTDSSEWVATPQANEWIGFVFTDPVTVEEVLVRCAGSLSTNARSPNIVRIEYADDESPGATANGSTATWTQQKRITGLTWAVPESKVLTAI